MENQEIKLLEIFVKDEDFTMSDICVRMNPVCSCKTNDKKIRKLTRKLIVLLFGNALNNIEELSCTKKKSD